MAPGSRPPPRRALPRASPRPPPSPPPAQPPPADPLTPHRFHILAALADRDLHGSGIVRDVLAQTDDGLRLWPVTLYKHLDEMASEGWIRELTGEERPEGVSERSRYYRITATGRRILEAEAERLTSIASQARRRLGRA